MIRQYMRKLLSRSPFIDGIFRRVIWSRIHFPEHELKVLHGLTGRPFDLTVDIGAALGSYTWVLNRKARDVVAFEPGEKHFNHINAARYLSRVRVINAAVGDTEGAADLMTPEDSNNGRHMATLSHKNPIIRTPNVKTETVQVVSLDLFLDMNFGSDRRLDLLKIDVEGFENAVLQGSIDRITRDHPVIIAEIEARHNPEYAVFFNTLIEHGYTCHGYRDATYVPFTPAEAGAQEAPDHFKHDSNDNISGYVNNFIFQHKNSAAKVLSL